MLLILTLLSVAHGSMKGKINGAVFTPRFAYVLDQQTLLFQENDTDYCHTQTFDSKKVWIFSDGFTEGSSFAVVADYITDTYGGSGAGQLQIKNVWPRTLAGEIDTRLNDGGDYIVGDFIAEICKSP